jgi:hypothetical protein
MKKLKISYFVSYYFTADNSGGFGNININSLKPLRSTEDIKIVSD